MSSTATTNVYQPIPMWTVTSEERAEIVRQVGRMNILSISGGRIKPIQDGIELPVSSGYKVRVHLTPSDDYVVERVMVRGAKTFSKGIKTGIYCDQVGEQAYRAGMFRSYDESEW